MHRFYLPPEQCNAATLFLGGREAHHAQHVLRLRNGDDVIVLDGAGTELRCRVEKSDRDKVQLEVTTRNQTPPHLCQITLLQSVPKGKMIESIIQKATELGVARVVPILSERVALQIESPAAARRKQDKWQQVAVEAIKQCGSTWLPRVDAPISPSQFLAKGETFDLPLVASLQSGSRHAREYFRTFREERKSAPRSVCIWIGPEGDFTPEEVGSFLSAGCRPITLGPLVLRCETAATYCLSIINYELQSPAE